MNRRGRGSPLTLLSRVTFIEVSGLSGLEGPPLTKGGLLIEVGGFRVIFLSYLSLPWFVSLFCESPQKEGPPSFF